jgi:signal transduction histidine kinase
VNLAPVRPLPRGLLLLAVMAVAVLLGSAMLSLRATERLDASVASVSDTQRVIEQVNRYWGVLGDRDSQILRYLLTGNPDNLVAFRATLLEMEQNHARLRALVGGDEAQRQRLDRLASLHAERVRRGEELIALKQRATAGDLDAQSQLDEEFDQSPGTGNAEAMRAVLEEMAAAEKSLLAERSAERARVIRNNRWMVLAANGFALLAGLAVLVALRRLRRRADEALRARLDAEHAQRVDREKSARLEEQQRLARERQEGLDLLAHDLRQHFGNILFGLELVPAATPEARDQLVRTARGAANAGLLFLEAVLEQGAGEARGEPSAPIPLAPLVRDATAAHERQAEAKQMSFALTLDDALHVRAQATVVSHVLTNLISNAVKYGPAGSAVDLVLAEHSGRARLEVLDRGPGVPATEQPFLFRRFTPLSTRPSGGEPTTGLGLALARQRARAQGAELRYEDRPGGGACFRVEWPLA